MDELPQQLPECSKSSPSLLSTLIDLMCPMEKYSTQRNESHPSIESKETKQNTKLHRQSIETATNIPLFPEILENKSQSCGTSKNILDLKDQTVHLDEIEIPKKKRKSKYSDIVGDLSHLSREPRRKRRNRYAGIHMDGTSQQYQSKKHYAREHSNNPPREHPSYLPREHPNCFHNPYCNNSDVAPPLNPPYSDTCTYQSPAASQSNILSTDNVPMLNPTQHVYNRLPKIPHRSSSSSIQNPCQSPYTASRIETRSSPDDSQSYVVPCEAFGAEHSNTQRRGNLQICLVRKLIEILMCPKTKAHQNCVLAILREDKNIKDLFIQEKLKLGLQVVPVFRNLPTAQEICID